MMSNCPYCGKPVTLVKAGNNTGQRFSHKFDMSAASLAGAAVSDYSGYDYERRTPAREPNLQADVAVPAAQSLLTGVAIGVPAAAVMGMLGYAQADCLATGAGLGAVSITATWLFKLGLHNQLLWLVESVTGRDIDGDGDTGEPEKPEVEPVRIEVVNDPAPSRFNGLNFELPTGVTQAMFYAWANNVAQGVKSPARGNWVGRGKPFSRSQYDDFLDALTGAGIIRDIGDGNGRQLTNGGRHALKRLLSHTAA